MSDATSSSLRSRFHPKNWPDHLRQRKTRDENGDDSARGVHDPHTWDNPDPSLRERITPDTVAQWLVLGAATLTALGLIVYLYPVFGATFQNPLALGAFGFVSYSILVYLKGRQDGIRAYINMAKSIVYYGDGIDIRLGKKQGEKGNRTLFTPYVSLSYGGFNKRELKKRDLPYDASKIRSNIEDDAGEEPVVDRLNVTTIEERTDNFGEVMLTHASDLKHDEFGQYSDRYTPMPTELDEDVVDDVNKLIDNLEHEIQTLNQKVNMQSEANADLRDLKDKELSPEMNQIFHLLAQLQDTFGPERRRRSSSPIEIDDPADLFDDMEVDQ